MEAECCALAGTDCRPTPLRQRAGRPQLKRDPLGRARSNYHMQPILKGIRQLAALAFAAAPLLGCSGATGPKLAACTTPVTVTTTSTIDPTFSWTPNCLVDQVTVEEDIASSAGGPQARWIITARVTGQGTGAPLGYGQLPPAMQEVVSPVSLVSGHEYSVRVYAPNMQVGVAVFRP